jgi:hypothetical protein
MSGSVLSKSRKGYSLLVVLYTIRSLQYLKSGLVYYYVNFNCEERYCKSKFSLRSLTILGKGMQHEEINIFQIGLRHCIHGFVAFIGFCIINFYIIYLIMNLEYGNRFAFIPGLMLLATPLVLIIVGTLNAYSLEIIYHRRTSQHWTSLLAQGLFVCLLGLLLSFSWDFLFIVVIFQLLRRPDTYASGPLMGVIFIYVPFILFIPSFGYALKETVVYFVGIQSEEFEKDEQRMDVSSTDGTN